MKKNKNIFYSWIAKILKSVGYKNLIQVEKYNTSTFIT